MQKKKKKKKKKKGSSILVGIPSEGSRYSCNLFN